MVAVPKLLKNSLIAGKWIEQARWKVQEGKEHNIRKHEGIRGRPVVREFCVLVLLAANKCANIYTGARRNQHSTVVPVTVCLFNNKWRQRKKKRACGADGNDGHFLSSCLSVCVWTTKRRRRKKWRKRSSSSTQYKEMTTEWAVPVVVPMEGKAHKTHKYDSDSPNCLFTLSVPASVYDRHKESAEETLLSYNWKTEWMPITSNECSQCVCVCVQVWPICFTAVQLYALSPWSHFPVRQTIKCCVHFVLPLFSSAVIHTLNYHLFDLDVVFCSTLFPLFWPPTARIETEVNKKHTHTETIVELAAARLCGGGGVLS